MKNWDGTYISVQTIPVFLSANPASQMPKSVFLSKLSYEHPAKPGGCFEYFYTQKESISGENQAASILRFHRTLLSPV
jgi:hypothetical protein